MMKSTCKHNLTPPYCCTSDISAGRLLSMFVLSFFKRWEKLSGFLLHLIYGWELCLAYLLKIKMSGNRDFVQVQPQIIDN